jgi:hypothetical protein
MRKILSNDRAFLRLIQGLFLFNVADALLSVQLIGYERELEEANPLWGSLLVDNPALFVFSKLALAGAGCLCLYKFRKNPIAKAGILLCFSAYYLLLCGFYIFVFR